MTDDDTQDVTVVSDVMVPMRDGVSLATDLYLPAAGSQPASGELPAVLQRTPYNKSNLGKMAEHFARNGYLSVVQDCRGRYRSEGEFFPFRDEPEDGYDTIAWLAEHPSCNGKVGMYGCSYMAWVQFHAATQSPPGLRTMIPYEGPINAWHYSMGVGGALHLGLLQWILDVAITSKEAQQRPELAEAVKTMRSGQDFLNWASRIPWRRGQTPLSAVPAYEEAAFQLYFENHDYSEFWKQPGLGMDEHFESFPEIPILWVVGWYDWYPRTITDGYQKMVAMGRKNQHLLVGPWTHNNFNESCGDVSFGSEGGTVRNYDDFLNLELNRFDRWLKNDDSASLGASVKFFLMGGGEGRRAEDGRLRHGGRWEAAEEWPPREASPVSFYLHEGGFLSEDAPDSHDSSTSYLSDPDNTVSSNGRCIIGYGPALQSGFGGMGPRDQIELETLPGHGIPGMPIAARPDVLVFQTGPLEEDLQIAGNIRAVLWVSSDAPDTDFFVKLLDVYPPSTDYPTGYAFPVSEGILRARYRDNWERPVPLEAGQIYRVEIALEPSANVFVRGHGIRVDVCSSNFPNFDINRNTGDPTARTSRIARNTIHHGADYKSCIELPVAREG